MQRDDRFVLDDHHIGQEAVGNRLTSRFDCSGYGLNRSAENFGCLGNREIFDCGKQQGFAGLKRETGNRAIG